MTARLIMKLQVASAQRVEGDVLRLSFIHPLRPELPAWTPGAHVDLRLGNDRIRQYSLCGDPADRSRYEIAVKHEEGGRGGSAWIHANLDVGACAHVSAPRNNFPLAEAARRHVFVAGGIGVTPFVAMARTLNRTGDDYVLHFCARSESQAPLLAELKALCGARLVLWLESEGRVFSADALGAPDSDTAIYSCGPGGLMAAVRDGALARGWDAHQLHAEVFQATLDENFKAEPFDVRLKSTGALLHVPADRSLLAVLRDHGVTLPSSCELGVCGSCECGYSEGIAIHRDQVLPLDARQDRILPCVSRARVFMTLDI